MSKYFYFKKSYKKTSIPFKSKKDLNILLDDYTLYSKMVYNDIIYDNFIDKNLFENNGDRFMSLNKNKGLFEKVQKTVGMEIQKQYNYIQKEFGVLGIVNFQNDQGQKSVNEKKFDYLINKTFLGNLTPKFKEKINFLFSEISNSDNYKNEENILKLFLTNKSLDVDNIYNSDYDYIKDENKVFSLYKNKFGKNIDFVKENEIFKNIIYQYEILQEIFSSYPNDYVDKDYIFDSFISNIGEIFDLLNFLFMINIAKHLDLEIHYSY